MDASFLTVRLPSSSIHITAHFLPASIKRNEQTVRFDEWIVVTMIDRRSAAVVANIPGVRLVRQSMQAWPRPANTGLKRCIFRLHHIPDGGRPFDATRSCRWPVTQRIPAPAFVRCASRIGANGESLGDDVYSALGRTLSEPF